MLELAVDGYLDERDRERATEGGREGGRVWAPDHMNFSVRYAVVVRDTVFNGCV